MKTTFTRSLAAAIFIAAGSISAFADGSININSPTDNSASGWTFASSTLTITASGAYTITGTGSATTNRVVVQSGVTAGITLNGVNIDVGGSSGACAFDIGDNSNVLLTLVGDNTLKSGYDRAGLKTGGGSARLEITAASDVPSLTATGGQGGAGIGGGNGGAGANITISGGIVTATGNNAAGIGGGNGGAGINISISGGIVTATGNDAAGIGGGDGGAGKYITISGGIVTATGNDAAGIGGGDGGAADDITISGGTVTATGNSAAGIGSGDASYTRVCISGGSINSTFQTYAQPRAKNCSTTVYLNTLTVGNPAVGDEPVTAGSIDGVACDAPGAYGIKDVKTDADGKVYFYLPVTSDNDGVELTAGGKEYGKEYARDGYHGYDQELVLLYGIELDPAGTHSFGSADYGYGAQSEYRVTVANTGTKSTGELTVALSGGNPSAFDLSDVPVSDITFNGSDNFAVTPKTGLASGTYTETVTVSGAHGISASFAVNFTVKAEPTPTVDDLAFDLSDTVYNGRPLPVAVTAGEGVEGLGAITVRYDGYTYIPDLPGTYTVTVDIAAGDNYGAIEGLLLGTFTVLAPPRPEPIRRTVTLPSVAGATTRPAAGRHVLVSGTDFEFILYPASALAGYEPSVTTDRTDVDGDPGAICTPNADGSYTVRIPAVRQDLTVAITFPGASTGTDVVEQTALTVYAVPGAIAVGNARSEAVVLRVYTLTGALVRRLTAAPGTTRLTVAPGVYIVTADDGSTRWKTTVSD
ncbi:MAG: hypothetical protein LBK22_03870 [Tannerella sp.]|jgi:hypothetical protein|nr:hypothetical protein [Tannerella sp.]